MNAAERLEQAFLASKLPTWAEFARRVGVEPGTMRAYKDDRFNPPFEVCDRIGALTGFNPYWLFEQKGPRLNTAAVTTEDLARVYSVPLVDEVTAGALVNPSSQIPEKDWQKIAVAGLPPSEYFALTVRGTSMDRVSPEGSIIIVDRNDRKLVSGKAYVFMIDDETTYKQWQEGDPPFLEAFSTDPTHKPRIIKRRKDLAIVGRVRRSILNL